MARRRAFRSVAMAAPMFLLLACGGPNSVAPARALLDAVKPEHLDYVEADLSLDRDQKRARELAWDGFEAWVVAEEGRAR